MPAEAPAETSELRRGFGSTLTAPKLSGRYTQGRMMKPMATQTEPLAKCVGSSTYGFRRAAKV